jgi:hypothetical protein
LKLDPVENAPLLAPLFDIPPLQERAPTLAPDELRRRQLAALTASVIAGARIAELSVRHGLPREVVDNVAARTGGVPLFVEEVTALGIACIFCWSRYVST